MVEIPYLFKAVFGRRFWEYVGCEVKKNNFTRGQIEPSHLG